eukprot:SAG11_NODE_3835_length_2196_cov_1.650453_2_plen_180_part_00
MLRRAHLRKEAAALLDVLVESLKRFGAVAGGQVQRGQAATNRGMGWDFKCRFEVEGGAERQRGHRTSRGRRELRRTESWFVGVPARCSHGAAWRSAPCDAVLGPRRRRSYAADGRAARRPAGPCALGRTGSMSVPGAWIALALFLSFSLSLSLSCLPLDSGRDARRTRRSRYIEATPPA